jgi:8-oxo-dGTP diphosphatase
MSKPIVKVVAALIRNQNGKILITRRPEDQHLGNYWEFPGGRIENGESPEKALIREIREEVNLEIFIEKEFWQDTFEYENKIIDIIFSLCRLKDEKQEVIPKEVSDFKWTSLSDLKKYPFPPADLKVIELLIQRAEILC